MTEAAEWKQYRQPSRSGEPSKTTVTEFGTEESPLFGGEVGGVLKEDTNDAVVTVQGLPPEDPGDAELETEIAATAQELVNAVVVQATRSHVVPSVAVASAVIGTLLGLIDNVELELDGWAIGTHRR
ncbi:hypothetical protein PC119_g14660 [Phytophthora cactorum]|nr:hypothetical protein PC114_g14095 [Phytophthora cactorum]KAG3007221.1 hypothetical protein PC119_g14660 [Phytophthora cactorum]KAG3170195.1 hypothetical protein C6341_g10885 [Phytophthora cactorum]KAG3179057.1 hypothetical protein PC128_g16104 [Phytophthora cactorum]KAG4059139.1 hypothetical protein PC123_g5923 [Phytophthora cactorum]